MEDLGSIDPYYSAAGIQYGAGHLVSHIKGLIRSNSERKVHRYSDYTIMYEDEDE